MIPEEQRQQREAGTVIVRREWKKKPPDEQPGVRELAEKAGVEPSQASDVWSEKARKSKRLNTLDALKKMWVALGKLQDARQRVEDLEASFDAALEKELCTFVPIPFERGNYPGIMVPVSGPGLVLRFASQRIPLFGGELRQERASDDEEAVRFDVFVRWRGTTELLNTSQRSPVVGDQTAEPSFFAPFILLDYRSALALPHPSMRALNKWSLHRNPYFCLVRYDAKTNSNTTTLFRRLLKKKGSPAAALKELIETELLDRTVLVEGGTDLELNVTQFLESLDLLASTDVLDAHSTSAAFHLLAEGKLEKDVVLVVGSSQYYAALRNSRNVRFLLTDDDLAPHKRSAYKALVDGMDRKLWDKSRYILVCREDSLDRPDVQLPWCARVVQKLSNIIKPNWLQMGLAEWLRKEMPSYGGVGLPFGDTELRRYVTEGMTIYRDRDVSQARFLPLDAKDFEEGDPEP